MLQNNLLGLAPSQTAIRRAAELGREMARKEQHCRPNMTIAHHYETYLRFRNAQRELMENSEVFSHRWMEKLFAIAEKDGRALGLRMDDSMSCWDAWYNKLVVPLKEIFWHGWEHSWNLQSRYAEARQNLAQLTQPPAPLRVAAARAAAQPMPPDLGQIGLAQMPTTQDEPFQSNQSSQPQAEADEAKASPWGALAAKPNWSGSGPAASA